MSKIEIISKNSFVTVIIILAVPIIVILPLVLLLEAGKIGGEVSENCSNHSTSSASPKPKPMCLTPECITLVHQLLNFQDPSVDPCENFYQAACGKYNEHNVIDGSRTAQKQQIVKRLIRDFLHKNQSSTSKSENSMKLLYEKCKEAKTIKVLGNQNLLQEIFMNIQKIGSWPVLDENWDGKKFNLNEMLLSLIRLGVSNFGFFEIIISSDAFVEIKPARNFPTRENLSDIISKVFLGNGFQPNITAIENDLREYENLQRELKSLERLIQTTPNRSLVNYLIFNYLKSVMLEYKRLPEEQCEGVVIDFLPRASTRVFVQNFLDKENRKYVAGMIEDVKMGFIDMIQESTWLNEESKKVAVQKVKNIKSMIGYPDFFEPPGTLDRSFKDLNIEQTDSYHTIVRKIQKFTNEQCMEFVASEIPLDPRQPILHANAFYQNTNFLAILAPVLDDPIFDTTFPRYVNLAVIGNVLAHEIGHAFDHTGINYDDAGQQRIWLTPEDSEEYGKRLRCLLRQHDEYDDPDFGRNLNGSKTLHEISADRFGVEAAWRTFKKLDLSNESEIVGFQNFNIDQLYFRTAALIWCRQRDTTDLQYALQREHPTNNFRVNGIYANMPQFAETFNCPLGSPMNPKKKCDLF
ncbi:NEPrilysin metallopeptidase family [Caenorhabditis elegans]|uniref:NEPrilysin metallopeptidase family n=1 Tax=Caenorhabditis elegans TaxID=6239 RepID=O16607_CAEEL|nr:NEPrilysin metallopeptidase family [Caenorhabditis elegans]CCD64806.1 NEPrilysin metallopeptidase family [Caenorhabditis elegans]|eukprot:NP_494679.2 NEPrilysin metallopeptidase family [Caenorhabditis elegans]